MQMYSCVLFVVLAVTISQVFSARPNDEIQLTAFNKSYYIANETYAYTLRPQYQVPLQLLRHVIYTATGDIVQGKVKRALVQNRDSLNQLAPDDYNVLSDFLAGDVPSYVRVDTKKRSLPEMSNGVRVIPLAKKAALFVRPSETQKRSVSQTKLGTGICLHIPFFTTCDNSQDLDDVKAALNASTQEFRTEIDSMKQTNDLRYNEMTNTLNKQRDLIVALAKETSSTLTFISNLASTTSTNAAQIAHGDYIIHAQIDYLKRVTNSLLRFSNALASTDPRSLVAQPSLTKLFDGYTLLLDYLVNGETPSIPIVDTRLFNWTEVPLPTDSVRNVVASPAALLTTDVQVSILRGFAAATRMWCNLTAQTTVPGVLRCVTAIPGIAPTNAGDMWILGAFHQNHVGIYTVEGTNVTTTAFTNVVPTNVPKPYITRPRINGNNASSLYCIDFLGYKMLSTFANTPQMLNGITTASNTSLSNCENYLFRNVQPGPNHYFLFAIISGVVVPFYSNCKPDVIIAATGTSTPINYLVNYPSTTNLTLDATVQNYQLFTTYDISYHHAISSACYMNIEPEWIGLEYYIPTTNTKIINNIPRGYKLNQFTINPAGQLSSSLEFLYTQKWAWVYKAQRTSPNLIIVDEASNLDGTTVLFNLDGDTVVDESDSFYGEGNNGRDCIRYRAQYDYDLLSCYYQNDQKGYFADEYLAGAVQTTGIARYVNKFQFSLDTSVSTQTLDGRVAPVYTFYLKPKNDADFSFYIDSDGAICPKLVTATSGTSGCLYTFAYTGKEKITFGPDTVTFTNNISNVITVSYNDPSLLVRTLSAGGKDCMLLKCVYGGNSDTSSVRVEKPNVQIVSEDDKNLVADVNLLVDYFLNKTLNDMKQVQDDVTISQQNLTRIIDALNTLDFNITKLVPYVDFTDLRAQVDKMIGDLNPTGAQDCASGVLGSAACWLRDIGNTLIVIVVVVLVALGLYLICVKCGVAKKIFRKEKV